MLLLPLAGLSVRPMFRPRASYVVGFTLSSLQPKMFAISLYFLRKFITTTYFGRFGILGRYQSPNIWPILWDMPKCFHMPDVVVLQTLDDLTIYLWVAFLVWTFFHIFLQSALVVVDGRLTLIVVFNLCGWSYQIFLQAITNP